MDSVAFSGEDLRRLQLEQLEVLKEVDAICRKEGIRYFLMYGTLLGAIRHKGFIPWDDDLDIGMIRSDYERFMKCAQELLGDEYFLQNGSTEKNGHRHIARIRVNGTLYEESVDSHRKGHHGIFIDIFPVDNVSSNKFARDVSHLIRQVFFVIQLRKQGCHVVFKRYAYIISALFLPFASVSFLKKWIQKSAVKLEGVDTGLMASLFSPYSIGKIDRELFSSDCYLKLKKIPFEGMDYSVPEKYHDILTQIYGDYMTLPPEEERQGRHPSSGQVNFRK